MNLIEVTQLINSLIQEDKKNNSNINVHLIEFYSKKRGELITEINKKIKQELNK